MKMDSGASPKIIKVPPYSSGQGRSPGVWILFLGVVLLGIFSSSNVAPSFFGDVAFVGSVLVLTLYGLAQDWSRVPVRRWALGLISAVILVLLYQMVRYPVGDTISNSQIVRVPVVAFLCLATLFYVPTIVDELTAMHLIAVVSAVVVLFGIPSLVLGPYAIGPVEFAPYTDFELPGTDIVVPALTSFYADSNAVSKLAMFGTLAGLYLEFANPSLRNKTLLGVNGVGVYLGHSRGAMLAFAAGVGMAFTYRRVDRVYHRGLMTALVVGAFLGFGLLAGLLPTPLLLESIPLGSRGEAWRAAFAGIQARPLLGYGLLDPGAIIAPYITPALRGLGPQNSFLYMYLATGALGGTLYLLFILGTLFVGVRDSHRANPALIAGAVAVFVLHFFELIVLFGANQNSLLAALFLGYLVSPHPGSVLASS